MAGSGGIGLSVAVVIVSYGHAAALPGLLDRLAAQARAGDEVIVVDNGRDGASAVARVHPAVTAVIETGANLGFAVGCNRGAARARAEAILFLNPDCLPEDGFLAAMRRPPPDWAAWMGVVTTGAGATVNTAGGVAHFTGLAWSGGFGRPLPERGDPPAPVGFLSGACLAVRHPDWLAAGGFAEDFFMYGEDVDLSHRLRLAGRAFGVLPAARVRHDYEFHKGGDKWRLIERNRILTVVRTYPGPLLAVLAPALVALEPALLAVAVSGGWGRAKLRSWIEVAPRLPAALAARRAIQARRRISSREFAAGLSARLDSPFLGGPARSPLVQAAVRGYWGLARGALRLSERRAPARPT